MERYSIIVMFILIFIITIIFLFIWSRRTSSSVNKDFLQNIMDIYDNMDGNDTTLLESTIYQYKTYTIGHILYVYTQYKIDIRYILYLYDNYPDIHYICWSNIFINDIEKFVKQSRDSFISFLYNCLLYTSDAADE